MFSFSCCIDSNDIDLKQCLAVLAMAKECDYAIHIHESWTVKLILKSSHNLLALNGIKKQFIDSYDSKNLIPKTALINGFGKCGGIDYALKVFKSIADIDCGQRKQLQNSATDPGLAAEF